MANRENASLYSLPTTLSYPGNAVRTKKEQRERERERERDVDVLDKEFKNKKQNKTQS